MKKRRPHGLHLSVAKNGKTYYSCLHPVTGKRHGLGANYATACKVLFRLQAEHRSDSEREIWNRIQGAGKTFATFIESKFRPAMLQSGLKPNTLKSRNYILDHVLIPRFGDWQLKEVEVKAISDLLDDYVSRGKARMGQSIRTLLIDIFAEAIPSGWIDPGYNPARLTKNPKYRIQRARLTLAQFKLIYEQASEGWERHMLELAILTSHAGATELSAMRKPKDGYLWIERTKTGEKVKIPLGLTLHSLGWNLGDTVKKCMSTSVLSPYLLHHTKDKGCAKRGQKLTPALLTNTFAALARKAGIDWGDKEPATLYEIRSLSERQFSSEGINTQILLAHKSAKSTAGYHDSRGDDWQELPLPPTKK